jgi:hypothetical protein
MWFRARNVQTEFVLTDYSEREIFKPKLFWLIPSERNVQTKVILIDSKREKRSNQNYFDWFQARNVQTKVILIDCVWENCFDWFRARNVQTQNCFEWFRATSVPKKFFVWLRVGTAQTQNSDWLLATETFKVFFREKEYKNTSASFSPDCPFAQPDMPKCLVMTRPLPGHKFTVECILFPLCSV